MKQYHSIYQIAKEKLSAGEKASSILNFIAEEAQKLKSDGSVVSILLLDKNGLLRNAASPKLPLDYIKAIDGIKPNPKLGTCAAVAATGKTIYTPDFLADEKWNELKHLPLAIGFKGAWSMPIKNSNGKVLGTFGTYFTNVRTPSDDEVEAVKILSAAVSEVIIDK
jgi:GAF domain-containing protein